MNIDGKGVLLIIAVITAGIIVLNQGFDKDTSASSVSVQSTQETQETEEQNQEIEQETPAPSEVSSEENNGEEVNEGSPSTSTSVLHPPAEVRVLVANGTDVTGAAGATLDTLVANAGYNGVGAVNDNVEGQVLLETMIYYSQGYDLDAQNVRLIINGDSSNVLPLPETLPIDDLSDANVLVHVGADLFPDQGG